MSPLTPMPMPREAAAQPDGTIRVVWRDGHVSDYGARELRLACPCAGCIDEWTGARRLDPVSVPEDVAATVIRRVGNYAYTFEWSDGHSTGIYAFDRLRALCRCAACAAV